MPDAPVVLTDALAECIELIEQENKTIKECLAIYPEHSVELAELLPTMATIKGAPEIRPTLDFRERSKQRLLGKISPIPVDNTTILGAVRHKLDSFRLRQPSWRYKMTWIVSILVIASVLVGGGTALAADAAVPGDALYPLDRAIEALQMRLETSPQEIVALQLAFAEERLAEAQELINGENEGNFDIAMDGYGQSIATVAKTIGSSDGVDQDALEELLEARLPDHDASLNGLAALDEEDPEEEVGEEEENYFCAMDEVHPVVAGLLIEYELDDSEEAELLMSWFCGDELVDGFGLGQIMLALQTAADGDGDLLDDAGDLLQLRADGMGWGKIWQGMGLVGKPVDAGPSEEDDPEEEEEDTDLEENYFCAMGEIHPAIQRLLSEYNLTEQADAELLMNWFCGDESIDGFGVGEIKLALQTAAGDLDDAGDLLEDRASGEGWGEIWQDLGLIGKPEGAGQENDKEPGEGTELDENYFCAVGEVHPAIQKLLTEYDLIDPADAELLMSWFCGDESVDGFGVGEIKLALQTADGDLEVAGDLLDKRADGIGWGEIWQEMDLIGKPDDAGQEDGDDPGEAGPPDDGPPGEGPPDHAGPPGEGPPGNGEPHNGNSPGDDEPPND